MRKVEHHLVLVREPHHIGWRTKFDFYLKYKKKEKLVKRNERANVGDKSFNEKSSKHGLNLESLNKYPQY